MKKAVIVGIGNYGGAQPELTASVNEAESWRDLLVDSYGFPPENIRMVCNDRATKPAILARLEWLLEGAAPGDQLVFTSASHGVRLRRRNPDGSVHDENDEAIVAYPQRNEHLEEYAIYDDDLLKVLLLSKLSPNVALTFILDCCFSGGIQFDETDQLEVFIPGPRSSGRRPAVTHAGNAISSSVAAAVMDPVDQEFLRIPRTPSLNRVQIPADIAHRERALARGQRTHFGEFRRMLREDQEPVLVASVPALDESPTGNFNGLRRTIFGAVAIEALRKNPTMTYAEFYAAVHPKMAAQGLANAPVVTVNKSRKKRPFFQ